MSEDLRIVTYSPISVFNRLAIFFVAMQAVVGTKKTNPRLTSQGMAQGSRDQLRQFTSKVSQTTQYALLTSKHLEDVDTIRRPEDIVGETEVSVNTQCPLTFHFTSLHLKRTEKRQIAQKYTCTFTTQQKHGFVLYVPACASTSIQKGNEPSPNNLVSSRKNINLYRANTA